MLLGVFGAHATWQRCVVDVEAFQPQQQCKRNLCNATRAQAANGAIQATDMRSRHRRGIRHRDHRGHRFHRPYYASRDGKLPGGTTGGPVDTSALATAVGATVTVVTVDKRSLFKAAAMVFLKLKE